MKSLTKRIVSLGLALTMAFGLSSAATVQKTQAAEKAYMDTMKLSELKENAKHSITLKIDNSNKTQKAVYYISDLEKTDAKKEGYKKLTFTFNVDFDNVTLSKTAIHKNAMNETNGVEYGHLYAVVDSVTGLDLETTNDVDVTCTNSEWKYSYYGKQKDSDGCWIKMPKKTKVKVTVVYPKTYKNLGIIVGMHQGSKSLKADDKFWAGKTEFGNTSYYKNFKKNMFYKKIK